MKNIITLFILLCSIPLISQESAYWQKLDKDALLLKSPKWSDPATALVFRLNINELEEICKDAGKPDSKLVLIPNPDGKIDSFLIRENELMPEELKQKFPEIRSYSGYRLGMPGTQVHLDLVPQGFHAMVQTEKETYFIDPVYRGNRDIYYCYNKSEYGKASDTNWTCTLGAATDDIRRDSKKLKNSSDNFQTLRTYKIAVATTGEYTAYHGGTVSLGLAAVVTAMNRVLGVYKNELGVSFTFVPNNNLIIYTNGGTDPYTNSNGSIMLYENQLNLDAVIGSSNYDVGHIFSTGGGGVAYLGVICDNSLKAGGVTGLSAPIGDPFYIDYVSHELGHQFGGNHTFNGNTGSCGGGNRNGSTAYEPGSGSTIQAYAGICAPQNLQANSHDYFHLISLEEMSYHVINEATCSANTGLANRFPEANANYHNVDGKYLPKSTPFELTGNAIDPDGDNMTYNWEEWDLGPSGNINPNSTSAPIFRSFPPSNSTTRSFPKLSDILSGTTSYGEVLPAVTRDLKLQFIVRDNNPAGGAYDKDLITLHVDGNSGPFRVTSQSTGGTLKGDIAVNWDVAGTNLAPVSCLNVDILLSVDGGISFSQVLATSSANDGSELVLLPNANVASARIKVKCTDNVFFDINENSFSIEPLPEVGNCVSGDVSYNNTPLIEAEYLSGARLFSAGRVGVSTTVLFTAQSEIILNPNFQVDAGSFFIAKTGNCN